MFTWNNLTSPRGFLFIGDPHVAAKAPGRRIDDYLTTVIGKLEYAAEICHRLQLVPVITGDLIHKDNENSIRLVNRLAQVLRKFPCPPVEVGGNHGKQMFQSSEDDVENLLATIGVINLVDQPGLAKTYEFEGISVNLFIIPHGSDLPNSLPISTPGSVNVLVSHHDLAVEGAYPGAKEVTEIKNCNMLVNGHMHKTAPSFKVGDMMVHNPGNIEPLSLDVANHEPAVWAWTTADLDMLLTQYKLPHNPNCFDLTGTLVEPAEDIVGAVGQLKESAFAQLMGGESSLEAHRTSDASVLMEDLSVVCDTADASEAARQMMNNLINQFLVSVSDANN